MLLVDTNERLGTHAEAEFVASIATGELELVDLTRSDWARCAALIDAYHDLGLGLVDASILAVAERLGITTPHQARSDS